MRAAATADVVSAWMGSAARDRNSGCRLPFPFNTVESNGAMPLRRLHRMEPCSVFSSSLSRLCYRPRLIVRPIDRTTHVASGIVRATAVPWAKLPRNEWQSALLSSVWRSNTGEGQFRALA